MSERDALIGDCLDKDFLLKMAHVGCCHNDDDKTDSSQDPDNLVPPANSNNDESGLLLTDLPSEILIHIASFLESRVIISSLYRVCKLFYELFSEDRYWKTRISQRWQKQYPVIERDDFNWRKACMTREEIHDMWSKPEEYYNHFMLREGFFAAVDVVHLMKDGRFLAVGSRDRHLNIVDLSKYDCEKQDHFKDLIVASETKAHKGWVWSMASKDDTLVTGSWDTYIRLWDINSGDIAVYSEIKLKTAILDLHFEPNFIAAGGFDKRLYMFDPRAPNEYIRKRYHTQPILSVTADDKYVITGSEDKVVAIYDRVAGKKYKTIETESFVLTMSYGDGQLWMGDKMGKLHVMDTRNGLFDETSIQTFDIGGNGRLTGVVHTDGGIFTCCSDSSVKVVEPSCNPEVIKNLTVHSGEVAGISYNNGVLASAGADIAVGVWIPKQRAY